MAASLVVGLSAKRELEINPADDAAGRFKKPRSDGASLPPPLDQIDEPPTMEDDFESNVELFSYPFFYYKDCAKREDPDPLVALTPPGRVPSFVAKLHAILSRTDLQEIVAWQPHGRSWKVIKPRYV